MPLASSDVDRFGKIPCQIGSTIVATAKTLMPNRYYDERKDFRIKSHTGHLVPGAGAVERDYCSRIAHNPKY